MSNQIRNIVFDMGNVLVRFDPWKYARRYGKNEPDSTLLYQEVLYSKEWIALDEGSLDVETAIQQCCDRLPVHLHNGVQGILRHWHDDLPPIPGMDALCAELWHQGYRLLLLSNTTRAFSEFSRHIAALRWFDGTLISAEYHLMKPDPEIFRLFCRKFSCSPQECFFVDDSAHNAYVAQTVGMSSMVFHGQADQVRQALFACKAGRPARN